MQDDGHRNPDPNFALPANSWENPRKRARYVPMSEEEAELVRAEKLRRRRQKDGQFQEELALTILEAMHQNRDSINKGTVNAEAIPFQVLGNQMASDAEYKYNDFRVKGQGYCPMNRPYSMSYNFLNSITSGVDTHHRDSDTICLKSMVLHLAVQLPERSIHELEAGVLDDDLQFYAVLDRFPQVGVPTYDDLLSVHDDQNVMLAFPNPRTANRFKFLYSEQFNMRYETLWEYTRADADKKAVCLGVMKKRVIELPVDGIPVSFIPHVSGYFSLLENNIFFCFITAKGVSITHGIVSDVKEMKTFQIDWNMRITYY